MFKFVITALVAFGSVAFANEGTTPAPHDAQAPTMEGEKAAEHTDAKATAKKGAKTPAPKKEKGAHH